jgi:hypothetical protein
MRALVVIAAVAGVSGEAPGQIVTTPNIAQLCRSALPLTHRKTVVYVDLAAVRNSKMEWGLTILNRLELAARETLTIVALNPSTFDVLEVFDACLPTLTSSEIDDARTARGLWDKLLTPDPQDQQRENLQTFDARLRNALDRIIAESKKYNEGERRDILGAIAFDKNRYSDQKAFYRIIVYTDGTVKEPTTERSLAERYPASFSGAEVAVFGIDGSAQDEALQKKEQTFSAFFLKNWAHLESFSQSLPQQKGYFYPPATRMDGVFEGGGTQGSLRLALFAAKEGGIVDGWLAFNVGREVLYVPFKGEYRCAGEECKLNAKCTQSVPPQTSNPYFRNGDRIELSGKSGLALEGSLQADSREVFKEGNQTVKYGLKFSYQ